MINVFYFKNINSIGGKKAVEERDKATKGKKLPKRVKKEK